MPRLILSALILPAVMLTLAGCGARGQLEPAEGRALPPAPFGTAEPPTAEELVAPTAQQRPTRSDELLSGSEERANDPFDLPPP